MLPKARGADLVVEELPGDETIVYDRRSKGAHCLNRTMRRIWDLSDGNTSVEDLARKVCEDLKIELPENAVLEGLYRLSEIGLLETPMHPPPMPGLTRRRLLWGASMTTVAMPILFSLAVPTAGYGSSAHTGMGSGPRSPTGHSPSHNPTGSGSYNPLGGPGSGPTTKGSPTGSVGPKTSKGNPFTPVGDTF